jgi:hypothetical protein
MSLRSRKWACPKPCPPPCPVMPAVPDQGGIMPVLWQPSVQTQLAHTELDVVSRYTLNVITTQWIQKGVLFRFQMWQGCDVWGSEDEAQAAQTYAAAQAANTLAEFDLIVVQDIPPATVLVVSITDTATSMFAYTGRAVYATGGGSVNAGYFGPNKSCVCFAFAPTASGAWTPAAGRPQFAIGFNRPDETLTGVECFAPEMNPPASSLAPNFPDQFSGIENPWTFVYRVVFPYVIPGSALPSTVVDPPACLGVTGLKFNGAAVTVAVGSWSNLRDLIAQPWTIAMDAYYSKSDWFPYAYDADPLQLEQGPNVGPFALGAGPGQLAVVYFQPRYKDINTLTTPYAGPNAGLDYGKAQLALLVTSPLAAGQTIYFTNEDYNAAAGGFGPRGALLGSATFQTAQPSFTWQVGINKVPAGTVVFIDNIGHNTSPITIVDAHDSTRDVGTITTNTIAGQAVVGLTALSVWFTFGIGAARPLTSELFVAAALSDQYSGDIPPLMPMLSMQRTRLVGKNVYGDGKAILDSRAQPYVVNNLGVFGTVQAPMVNAATPTSLPDGALATAPAMPVFLGMADFAW